MMYLAEEAAKSTFNFHGFDIFMILFTLIIAWGVIRSLKAKEKNKFAIGFGLVALLVFVFTDAIMVANWLGLIGSAQ